MGKKHWRAQALARRPYKAPLNRPGAPWVNFGGARPDDSPLVQLLLKESSPAEKAKLQQYQMKGLKLLCQHYGISWAEEPAMRFYALALCLAVDHVPYFSEKMPKSRRWTFETQFTLLRAIGMERLAIQKQLRRSGKRAATTKGACIKLAGTGPYLRDSASSLEARCKAALRVWLFRQLKQSLGEKEFWLRMASLPE